MIALLFRYAIAERVGTILLSVLVAHTGWHWMLDRGATLSQFPMPAMDVAFFLGVVRALLLLTIVAGALWLLSLLRRPSQESVEEK